MDSFNILICKAYTVVQCHSDLMRGKNLLFFPQVKSHLSTQSCNLADAWKLQVGKKGEHMGSSLQGCKASAVVGSPESRTNAVHSGGAQNCSILHDESYFPMAVVLPKV